MPGSFIVDLLGKIILEEEIAILQHPNVGAILLFTRNFENPTQLRCLIQHIKSIRPDIFIAVDHEGGIVQRFQRHGFTPVPAAHVYGRTYDINPEAGCVLAREYGTIMASELLDYGVDLSLAPVLDLHGLSKIIGGYDRAFHSNPDSVIELARAFIQGMREAGMPAVGKHYPGHGSVVSDSHIAMPVYEATLEDLTRQDLKPFVELIRENILSALMPAHVTYPAVDPDNAAGFSKIWLQDKLRDEYHFQGLVMSDCLGMEGADIGNMNVRANQALTAGCDMLIVCNQTRELLLQVLQTTIFEQSLASYERIKAFKNKMRRFWQGNTEKVSPYIAQTLHHYVEPIEEKSAHGINNTTSI